MDDLKIMRILQLQVLAQVYGALAVAGVRYPTFRFGYRF